jgi:ABC-2 type transport system ATP-binding protein
MADKKLNENTDAISIRNLRKSFGTLKVLDGINLNVKRGTILALLGPNGAGKTTTVHILSTLIKSDKGTAKIEGIDVAEDPAKIRTIIGLTGQYAAVDELLTGRENLRMIGRLYHLEKSVVRSRTETLLDQFGLMKAADRKASTYSGGMRRRLDLAASLIASPPVIFLDEPTTGLDPRSRLAMWDSIKQLVQGGSTILLTTQYLEEADQLADRIAVLDGGKIIAEGTADELKKRVGKDRTELTFATRTQFDKALEVLQRADVQIDEQRLSITQQSDGVRKLRELLEKLEAAKVKVEGISLHKPTLDDVFLQLTGHAAEKKQPTKKEDEA